MTKDQPINDLPTQSKRLPSFAATFTKDIDPGYRPYIKSTMINMQRYNAVFFDEANYVDL